MILNRLDLIYRLGLVSKVQLIQVLLQRIKFVKQLFVIELEYGKEVAIPSALSQTNMPSSFRFYDPIIKIAQQRVSVAKQKKLKMQQSLIKHLSDQYSLMGLFGAQKKEQKKKASISNSVNDIPLVGIRIDYKNSLHTNQIQRSNYIKLDDNLLNFNFDRSKRKNNPQLSNEKHEKL